MSGFFGGGGRPNPQPPGRGYDDRVPPGSAYGGPNHGDDRYRQAPQQDYGGYSDEKYRQGGLPPGPRMSGGSGGGGMPRPSPQGQVQRRPPPADSQVWQLEVVKSPSDDFTYRNLYVTKPFHCMSAFNILPTCSTYLNPWSHPNHVPFTVFLLYIHVHGEWCGC